MTVLLVLAGLGLLLGAWCWWEARTGRPAWGAHLQGPLQEAHAARLGKGAAASAALGAAVALDGGADG